MTVCIGAVSREGMLFMISDRMLTSGDIQFGHAPKTRELTSSICIMQSGDASFQGEIIARVQRDIDALTQGLETWLPVTDVVELYVRHRNEAKKQRSASAILAPLGLDHESFLSRQSTMQKDLVGRIAEDLINYPVPEASVIIAGIDETGPRIFIVDDGVISCHDVIGFAAIGSGARHAESQMMSAGHSSREIAPTTLVNAYIAKRRAEVAPGVSADTDVFMNGPRPGTLNSIKDEIHEKMRQEYEALIVEEKSLQRGMINKVDEYVSSISEKPATAVEDQGEARSADAIDDPDEAKKDGRGGAERSKATKGQR